VVVENQHHHQDERNSRPNNEFYECLHMGIHMNHEPLSFGFLAKSRPTHTAGERSLQRSKDRALAAPRLWLGPAFAQAGLRRPSVALLVAVLLPFLASPVDARSSFHLDGPWPWHAPAIQCCVRVRSAISECLYELSSLQPTSPSTQNRSHPGRGSSDSSHSLDRFPVRSFPRDRSARLLSGNRRTLEWLPPDVRCRNAPHGPARTRRRTARTIERLGTAPRSPLCQT
jgi:hypothetical protein